ncbi:response regulator [Clostridium cylindrosporum]|uniref:Stage 0 sporulation protein A homolog n=1 Tax=Clostridium cylindrosporum DSM 605 TaxID=1121307 RepID=A0A0J8D7P0_CLOCY|nr:response regulator [Clostridium cylindrosporum]KMT21902.1 chemotaxis protein CheY [Clostridium cylindrosporum DSM 605]
MSEYSLKILICDDSMLMRKRLKESLSLCGCFDILEATNGQAAVDIYKEESPDLVFMDLVMPIKDGITAVFEIKEFDKKAKIIIASSSGTQENLKKAIKAGAIEFIQKPWGQDQLNRIIKNFTKKEE